MINIRKKIIAVSVVSAMAVSMVACSDDGSDNSSSNSDSAAITAATLTSEEAEQLRKIDFTVAEYIPPAGEGQTALGQDPVEQDSQEADDSSADGNNAQQQDPAGQQGEISDIQNDPTGFVVTPGNDNPNSSGNSNENQNQNQNPQGEGNDTIKGTKKIYQAYWMNLDGDFKFDGEFMTAEFKIKESTPNGTYPITIDWLDFSNISAVSLDATGINGSIVVGGAASETQFKNDGSFEVKADSVSGNPGDTVKVSIRFKNNPGICANVLRFGYDSDALEIVKEDGTDREKVDPGADFVNALETQNT